MREIHDLEAFRQHVSAGHSLSNVALQELDLRQTELTQVEVSGALLLGCVLTDEQLCQLNRAGALVFPKLEGLPYESFRAQLYDPRELFGGFDLSDPDSYCETPDARIYRHYLSTGKANPPVIRESLARRLHDHSITDALHDFLQASEQARRGVVAMMGGHGLRRDSTEYRQVAQVARELAERGLLMISGGGPGAMEATHLGARMAERSDDALSEAIHRLADFGPNADPSQPDYRQRRWLANAFEVMERFPPASDNHASLGIPTWLYGHEPPTPLASHIAKYFSNSVREEGLITIAEGGIIFAPGSFGTFQEVFQDAAQNHYATQPAKASPMVFLNESFWRQQKPVFTLLERLSASSQLRNLLTITDSVDEAVEFICTCRPRTGAYPKWSFCADPETP